MCTQYNRRLAFLADWYQEEAAIIRTFIICFYLSDNAIEVFDQKSKKTFLRRTKMPELTERDFFLGSKLNIFGRQFDIVDYGDEATKNTLAKYRKKTFFLLKNSILKHLGEVLCGVIESDISVSKALMIQFTAEQVKSFLKDTNAGDVQTSVIMNQLLTGPCVGLELIADNIVDMMTHCLSLSKECTEAKYPKALQVLFENEEIRNGIYASMNDQSAARDLDYFFSPKTNLQITCTLKNSTLAIIKPHCIKEGNLGKLISEITTHGFIITGLRMYLLERVNCEEFYEVYRGILPEYIPMVAQLASGNCLALEICCEDDTKSSYEEFRKFCGPMDPEIAKLLRPDTLRSKFGHSKTLNAIHCTDLPDDTVIELQYLFKILD